MNKNNISRNVILIIGIVILITGMILLAIRYPLASNKDFLDILSSLGSAISAIGILLVIYELLLKEKELSIEKSPDIEIGVPEIISSTEANLPSGILKCLCETTADQLPTKEELFETFDDYHTLWHMAKHVNQETENKFIVFDVTNHQENVKGTARSFAVKLRVTYYRNDTINQGLPLDVWVPARGCAIHGQTRLFYVRCGPITDPNHTHVAATILKYKCNNRDGESFEIELNKGSTRKTLSI